MSNHICNSQSSSFTEAAYELGTSASEAFDTGNSSGLGPGLEMDNAGFFSATRSGTSSQSSFRNMNENEVNAAAAASFASMSSQGSISAVTNAYDPQEEYINGYVPPFSRSPASSSFTMQSASPRASGSVVSSSYSMQQASNGCNQSASGSSIYDMGGSGSVSNQYRPSSTQSNTSMGSKKCTQQQTAAHGYDLVASDAFRATLSNTNNGYGNGMIVGSYSKAQPSASTILEEPECMENQMWSHDCDQQGSASASASASSAPCSSSSYGFSPYGSQQQSNYTSSILASASIYTKTPQSGSPTMSVAPGTAGTRVSFGPYNNGVTSSTIPSASNNYIGTISGSVSSYNKPMTPVMTANSGSIYISASAPSASMQSSNSFNASGYGSKSQTPIGSNSMYGGKPSGSSNCGHNSPLSSYGYVSYSASSSNPPCSASIYSKPATPQGDADCSSSQMWGSDCSGSQQVSQPQSPFRPATVLSNSNKCNGSVSASIYSKPATPQCDPDCSGSQMWGSDMASQQASTQCANSPVGSPSASITSDSARGSVPAVSARASIGSLRASFSVSQIASSSANVASGSANPGSRTSNVSFGVTSNGFGGSTSALYSKPQSQQHSDCRHQSSLASASSANFNSYEMAGSTSNTFGASGSARTSGPSTRVSFASFNESNAQQQQSASAGCSNGSASIYMKPQGGSNMGSASQIGFSSQSASALYGSASGSASSKPLNTSMNASASGSGSASARPSGYGSARPSAMFGSGSNSGLGLGSCSGSGSGSGSGSTAARLSSASFVASGSSKPMGSGSIIASGSLYLSGSGLSTSSAGNKQRSLFSSGSSSSLASNSGSMNASGSAILSTSGSTRQSTSNLFASGSGLSILSASVPVAPASASASARPSVSASGSAAVSNRLASASFAMGSSSNPPCSQAASGFSSNVYGNTSYNSTSTYQPESYRPSLSGSIISIGLTPRSNNSASNCTASASTSASATVSASSSSTSGSASARVASNTVPASQVCPEQAASSSVSPVAARKSQTAYSKPQTPTGSSVASSAQCKPPSPVQSAAPAAFESKVEASILKSTEPIQINETQEISALGNRGIWANRCEVCTWKGDLPINEYPINEDACPEIINKKSQQRLQYNQEIAIRYLKPPAPPAPGEIIIKQEPNQMPAPAPPIVIRQQPPRPCTPEPLVIREAPPQPPPCIGQQIITISGRRLPAPPRKVVIERMAPIPSKPQSVLIERWMPYAQAKRKVIFQAAPPDPVLIAPRNIIVQWEAPEVCVKKDIRHLGIICANPCDYAARYGSSMKKPCELPKFVLDIQPQCGVELAANKSPCQVPELEGDIDALKLIDLDKEGLGMYKKYVNTSSNCNNNSTTSNTNSNTENGDCENRYSLSEGILSPPYSPVNNSSGTASNSSQQCSQSSSSSSSNTQPLPTVNRYSPNNLYSNNGQSCY